jgi:hypothetical protein
VRHYTDSLLDYVRKDVTLFWAVIQQHLGTVFEIYISIYYAQKQYAINIRTSVSVFTEAFKSITAFFQELVATYANSWVTEFCAAMSNAVSVLVTST